MGRRHKHSRSKKLVEAMILAQNRKEDAQAVNDNVVSQGRLPDQNQNDLGSATVSQSELILAKWAPFLIALSGVITFVTGIRGKFMPDDALQITSNPVVHSLSNVGRLFSGGTYFNGTALVGNFYRPLMTTTFSALYTFFGANPMPFHILQLALYIVAAIVVFRIFVYRFSSFLAFGLALIFLVHPINSQVVYSISALQDVLYFLFGILAVWFLFRSNSSISMVLAVVCLFFSLLSKESGALFILVSLVYLYISDRKRMWQFVKMLAFPLVLYLILRLHAVGMGTHTHEAIIDNMSLWGRIVMMPSIMWFYLRTFIWPVKLASGYYWADSHFTLHNFWLPLIVDLVVIGAAVYGAWVVRRTQSQIDYVAYCFFAIWAAIGMVYLLQVVPLDMTACTNWFIFSMAGILGMIGEVSRTVSWRLPNWRSLYTTTLVILIILLAIGSFMRGFDWKDEQTLSIRNISAAPANNVVAYSNLSDVSYKAGDYQQAADYATKAIAITPGYAEYNNLGYALLKQGYYPDALAAFQRGLKYYPVEDLYDGIAVVSIYDSFPTSQQLLMEGLKAYPHDSTIWTALIILQIHHHDHKAAVAYLSLAMKYSQVSPNIYNDIMNQKPFYVDWGAKPILIQ